MKLINKTSLYYLVFFLPVMIISGILFYFLLIQQIDNNIDESLFTQKKIITNKFYPRDTLLFKISTDADNDVEIQEIKSPTRLATALSDTFIFDNTEGELVPFRILKSNFTKNGRNFLLTITRSNIKRDELAENIAIGLAALFAFLLLTLLLVNRFLSQKLWTPFNETLEMLNSVSFSDMQPNSFKSSTTSEFLQLNVALNRMTEKLFTDFNSQKQFTENASHELQTPLAVIKSRIDLLIQNKDVTAEIMEQVQEIEKSANKLSHLNKSLLLLSKIENRQFEMLQIIELPKLIDKTIFDFEEHINRKHISIQKKYYKSKTLELNALLAEVLFSNLLQNAIRHNSEHGIIEIELNEKYCTISNSGDPFVDMQQKLFSRFVKFNPDNESIGLGLAIVKQICDYYSYTIEYSNHERLHCFKIVFNN